MSRRKITYLTGTRADFGLMKSTLALIDQVADLGLLVTGMHLDPAYGDTLNDVQQSGLKVLARVPMDMNVRTPLGMSNGIAQCLAGVGPVLHRENPDLLLLLGDRGEMLAGATAALHLGIPTVHLHGGERSGTVDEPVRHAISKLSTFHFVATTESRERLIRMGEPQDRIWVTGAPGLDGLVENAVSTDAETRQRLGMPAQGPFILGLFHPVVQQSGQAYAQTSALLKALRLSGWPVAWLEPNADAGSLEVLKAIDEQGLPAGSRRFKHLERSLFCDGMRWCSAMVGNSSSGIIEAATFGTPVINVGDRQRLRERNANVTDVEVEPGLIFAAIDRALATGRLPCHNRFGDGRAGLRIRDQLLELPLGSAIDEKSNSY